MVTATEGPAETPATTETATTETATATDTPTPTIAEVVGTPALTHDGGVEEFGRAVALSDGTAVVVAEGHGAYVFEAGERWTETTVLVPDDGEDFGGHDVSATLAGDVAVVGGPEAGAEPDAGAVYLFERVGGEWTQRHRFGPDDEPNQFGRAVAFDGRRVVVGDVHDPETMVPWTGGAYVFEGDGTNWTREAHLGTDAQDLFGTSVAVDDDAVLVGAPYATPTDEQTGAVYAYGRVGGEWQRQATLVPEEPERTSLFGRAVAVDGDTAVVGAPGTRSGSVHVFERTDAGWVRRARVVGPGNGPAAGFGRAVAVEGEGETAVVGAPGTAGTGRAFVVEAGDEWTKSAKLVAAAPGEDTEFGVAVALSGATALVGAPAVDDASAAYLFDL